MAKNIDLTPSLKRPLDPSQMGRDVAALNNLVGVLNDPRITGAEVPPGEDVRAKRTAILDPNALPDPAITEAAAHVAPAPAPAVSRDISKVFYTGRLGVGKDHVAAATGATIFGLADPIYFLVNQLTGLSVSSTSGKDTPGVRAAMQQIGQWGRNTINASYPVTPARMMFVRMIQAVSKNIDPQGNTGVDWTTFGIDEDIWFKALLKRVEKFSGGSVAVTNVRFANEYKQLVAAGWQHYHVMCSPATWAKRLAKQKLTPESPQVKDTSELLAQQIDADAIKQISRQPSGPVLHVIWNDPDAKCPSSRFLTTAQFLQECSIQATPAQVNTGE